MFKYTLSLIFVLAANLTLANELDILRDANRTYETKPNIVFVMELSDYRSPYHPGLNLNGYNSIDDSTLEIVEWTKPTADNTPYTYHYINTLPAALIDFTTASFSVRHKHASPRQYTGLLGQTLPTALVGDATAYVTYLDSATSNLGTLQTDHRYAIPGFTTGGRPWAQLHTHINGNITEPFIPFWTDSSGIRPAPLVGDLVEFRFQQKGIGRLSVRKDLLKDIVYKTHAMGGAHVAIMYPLSNTAGNFRNPSPPPAYSSWPKDPYDAEEPNRFSSSYRSLGSRDPDFFHDYNDNGSYVLKHFEDTSTLAGADAIVEKIHNTKKHYAFGGSIPYAETMQEIRTYFQGGTSLWDKSKLDNPSMIASDEMADPRILFGDSTATPPIPSAIDPAAYVSGDVTVHSAYNSIWDTNPCGHNVVIMLEDGTMGAEGYDDFHANTQISTELGGVTIPAAPYPNQSYDPIISHSLLDDYIKYLGENDLDGSAGGTQTIEARFIATNEPMDSVFDDPGSEYNIFLSYIRPPKDSKRKKGFRYGRSDTDPGGYAVPLSEELEMTVEDIINPSVESYSLVIPPAEDNAFRQGTAAYLTVSTIDGDVSNIKRFNVVGGQVVNTLNQPIFDANGNLIAANARLGVWAAGNTDEPLLSGGAIEVFDHTATTRYFQYEASPNLGTINTTNGNVTGGASPSRMNDYDTTSGMFSNRSLIKQTGGVDAHDSWDGDGSRTDSFAKFGAALHAEPKVFQYHRSAGGISRLFLPTNMGFLHSFDANTGKEKWAIAQRRFLKSVSRASVPQGGSLNGLDGDIELLHLDENLDSDLLSTNSATAVDPGEKLYLYASARRGGQLLIGLDVTHPDTPDTLWRITETTTGFANLGDTWSTPKVSYLQKGPPNADGTMDTIPVLFVGAGYDDAYDDPTFSGTTTKGAGIYMIDAVTGTKLWGAALTSGDSSTSAVGNMNYPIVSDIKPFDVDFDGAVDLFYAVDIMGQIFRCDIEDLDSSAGANAKPSASEIGCDRIARLDSTNSRRFYADLDAVTVLSKGGLIDRIGLAIGSGNINTPDEISTTKDRFYVVFDESPMVEPTTHLNLTQSDLANATSHSSTPLDLNALNKKGWYIELNNGEKVLSGATTFLHRTSFQTYYPFISTPAPTSAQTSSCPENEVTSGYSGRNFLVNLKDASLVTNAGGADPRSRTTSIGTGTPRKPTVLIQRSTSGEETSATFSLGGAPGITTTMTPTLINTHHSDELRQ